MAVASRSLDRAQAFADRHGIDRAHGSYADIVADPDVDVLYVATPHPQHHALSIAALRAGKALLVEKAFTATTAGAQEVVDLARETGVFVMEAMWTRFQPAIVAVRELIADGAIGEVRSVQADLGVAREYDPVDRLFDLALGGARCSTSASTSSTSPRCSWGRRIAWSPPARCSPRARTPRHRCSSTTATAARRPS
ncbi:Gfo/Idh/MocA family oxidoreductase [Blastococcus brunescens]|uniref:Gfo/Idh/MocA family oxidoreductase n=1 Tax=Blastococcus brunescens TaxID=1564165 RepID=A0ABZ1B1H1_9ACTN|nr:Gfo/Idh/MocA family oxidoreductase [Blastococcus sp. BMG 8361]WRL64589.1 Gfo/Idh/MocA family oxidoreductase [Blastococcus sp. BMG 8361]